MLTGASAQLETLLDLTGTRRHLEWLETRSPGMSRPGSRRSSGAGTPFDNAVNDRVAGARVMAVSDAHMWVQAADSTIHRPWAPPAEGFRVAPGTQVEVYFDAAGTLNGWYDPRSGLAINQRGLDPGDSPATHSDLACQGPCGLVWHAPAAARRREGHERCLTCAGSFASRGSASHTTDDITHGHGISRTLATLEVLAEVEFPPLRWTGAV